MIKEKDKLIQIYEQELSLSRQKLEQEKKTGDNKRKYFDEEYIKQKR